MKKLMSAFVVMLGIVGLGSIVFGEDVRKLYGSTSDALSGDEPRTMEMHKGLTGFSKGGCPPDTKCLGDFTAEASTATRKKPVKTPPARRRRAAVAGVRRPATGEVRTAAEIAERPFAGVLTAKEWNDTIHYDEWQKLVALRQDGTGPLSVYTQIWPFPTEGRITVQVRRSSGAPAVDVPVALEAGGEVVARARTDNAGRAYLFPRSLQGEEGVFQVRVAGSQAARAATPGDTVAVTLKAPVPEAAKVGDVMLVMDTTGSMGDELRYLQSELEDVLLRARERLGQSVDLRVSVNFYRDRGDAYVVRSFPFTADLAAAEQRLLEQTASGGGDTPEAVDLALADALEAHRWSPSARGRILFLVLDAPPHHRGRVLANLERQLRRAARLGVRIVPVAASGVDKSTEVLLRQMAVLTGGRYVYLTDDSGVGEHHVEATGSRAQTERLNDLLTRVIVETLRSGPAQPLTHVARR